MHALILFAVMHGVISISPIRIFQPFPTVKCPPGYALWWPSGKEFDNDKYAECIKPIAEQAKISKPIKQVSLRQTAERH